MWHEWLGAGIMGQAVLFLVEQDVLPRLGDNPPAKWEFAAWRGTVPMAGMA
jgi:hypothetical protein